MAELVPVDVVFNVLAVAACKLATSVVDVTTNGAVPIAAVEFSWPLTVKLVPVAAPILGVVKIGEIALTTLPVPIVGISSTTPAPDATRPSTLSDVVTFWIFA